MRKTPNNKGFFRARNVLEDCGLLDDPLGLTIEDIALSRGITDIQSIKIDGAQGRIMVDGNEAVISYNCNISHEGKKRFVIAHELGHFELHQDLVDNQIHLDDDKSLSEWYAKGKHELEANQFASEFLMPSHLFEKQVKGKLFNFNLIKEVANYFQTSITSTLIKYRVLGDFPIAIIFCDDAKVKWSSFSEDFYLQYIPKGIDVPVNSVANDFYYGDTLPDSPEPIDVMDWFSQDFKAKKYENLSFYEQCIRVGENGVLSCIWND